MWFDVLFEGSESRKKKKMENHPNGGKREGKAEGGEEKEERKRGEKSIS